MRSATNPAVSGLDASFRELELESYRLAARGRLVAIAIFAVYSVLAFDGPLLTNTLTYLALFALLATGMLWSVRVNLRWPWIPYVLVALEVAVLAEAVLTPNPFNPDPWPDPMVFRYDNFYYFFALIAVSVFSYSPGLVLWAGVCTAAAWSAGVAWVAVRSEASFFAEVVGQASSSLEALALYVDPGVIVLTGRIKEVLTALMVSALLAAVVWRGRRTVRERIAADADRRLLEDLFGRYVPQEIADAIIEDRGVLEPEEREATVLFADIVDFTATVEKMSPAGTVDMLNEYFAAATEVISRHNGVVTQFQGDAILASFNVPVPSPQHASEAVAAALELLALVAGRRFAGQSLALRVGVNTGPVVAGSVGGSGRMHYTVHGDAVNTASRLEQLNKETGTAVLVSESTRALAPQAGEWDKVAEPTLRGRSRPLAVYTLR